MILPRPYRARPARRDDLDAARRLFEARDLADVGFVDQSREEIIDDWTDPSFDLARDTVVGEAPDGSIVGVRASCWRSIPPCRSSRTPRCIPITSSRGLGTALVEAWSDAPRRDSGPGSTSPFRMDRTRHRHRGRRLFLEPRVPPRALVLAHAARPCRPTSSRPAMPEGIVLRMGSADDEPDVHGLLDETFRDHFGYEPESFEHWQAVAARHRGLRPDAHRCSRSPTTEPVGVSVNRSADDGVGLGRRPRGARCRTGGRGRRRGAAGSLVRRARRARASRGALGVDTENCDGRDPAVRGRRHDGPPTLRRVREAADRRVS